LEWRPGAGTDGPWASLAASRSLVIGDTVRTGDDSYGALAMATGAALRLDGGTELEMTGGDEIYLRRGAVYVEAPGAATLAIRTDHGLARDIGTRYEVRVGDNGWRVQVREGRVVMNDARAGAMTADAGERIVVQDAAFALEKVSSTDASWHWTHRAAPPMAIEGAVLSDYLAWWSRETGIAVRYQRPIDEAIAAQTQLHGSLDGLSLEDGFGAVTRGAGYRVVDRTTSQVMLAR
jgi:ferric-dicitrate binding protein FerR (iron transport regulator)